jgi:hypothetical protein
MSGAKRNPDKLNTIGVVVIGVCGAVLVYVTIVALQAFYMDDTAELQTTADYGGQEDAVRTIRSTQRATLDRAQPNPTQANMSQTWRIPIDTAMVKVVESARDAKTAAQPVPQLGYHATKATAQPVFGRPRQLDAQPSQPRPPGTDTSPPGGEPGPNSAEPGNGSAGPAGPTFNFTEPARGSGSNAP